MTDVFRNTKSHRNGGIVCLAFFLLMAGFGAFFASTVPPDRRLFAYCFFVGGFGVFVILSLWMILAYYRQRLEVRGEAITHRGVLSTRQCELFEVVRLEWKVLPTRIVLHLSASRVKIELGNFAQERQLTLIRYFRSSLPEPIQDHWPEFCLKVALPLRDGKKEESPDRELKEGEVRVTRRRRDLLFLPGLLLVTPVAIYSAWRFNNPLALLAPVFLLLLWLWIRYATPKEGMIERVSGLAADAEEKRVGRWMLSWCVAALASGVLLVIFQDRLPHSTLVAVFIYLFWFPVFMFLVFKLDRLRKAREKRTTEAEAPAAMEQWERGEGEEAND